jgi:hypothetical protein
MDGRCATCKWWLEQEFAAVNSWRICDLTVLRGGDAPKYPESRAYAEDAESYRAWLVTAPDFGCVQWERKES